MPLLQTLGEAFRSVISGKPIICDYVNEFDALYDTKPEGDYTREVTRAAYLLRSGKEDDAAAFYREALDKARELNAKHHAPRNQ